MEFIVARSIYRIVVHFLVSTRVKKLTKYVEILKIRKFLLGNKIFLIQKLVAILKEI